MEKAWQLDKLPKPGERLRDRVAAARVSGVRSSLLHCPQFSG